MVLGLFLLHVSSDKYKVLIFTFLIFQFIQKLNEQIEIVTPFC